MHRTLLINWVYYNPVGHALEGFKAAKGYSVANMDIKISILLNSQMPCELGALCPWIERVYPIDIAEVASLGMAADCLKGVPREWDYLISDERLVHNRGSYNDELVTANQHIVDFIQARRWKGCRFQKPNDKSLRYAVDTEMTLIIPQTAKDFIKRFQHTGLKICLLPAGSSGDQIYPRSDWWMNMIDAVSREFPSATFYLTGVKNAKDIRTTSRTFTADDMNTLLAKANVVDCFDIGIVNQTALLQYCDILISPHSGFAFLASCVKTPWLTISGGSWGEYFYNHTKFYNVFPSCSQYPCFAGMKDLCRDNIAQGKPIACMETKILDQKIPEIIHGIRRLQDTSFTYADSVALYRKEIGRLGFNSNNFWTFDLSFDLG